MTRRLGVLSAAGTAVLAALVWVAASRLPPKASEFELAMLTRPSKPGLGICVGSSGAASRCDALAATNAARVRNLRTHAALFAHCMAGHGSPVGEPRFSHGKGGFSVSFPSYDVRRLSFRAAYVHCGPLLGP
jgi:hypothetical protein